MKRSVFSYVIALCLILASTTHTFAFHFPGEHATAQLQTSNVQQTASVVKPAGCSNVVGVKSLFVAREMWVIGNIASVEDHQRCHAAISSAVEHAGISPAAEIVRPNGQSQSSLLARHSSGFKEWRFKPPLRPPQIG